MFSAFKNASRASALLGLTGLFLAGIGTTAFAEGPSYTVSGWSTPGSGDYTLGYTFTPTTNVTVTSLGEWIGVGDVFSASETVGIFDNSTNALLFSTPYSDTTATITGNTLGDGSEFRYVDITSLASQSDRTLLANHSYTMAGTVGHQTYFVAGANDLTSPAQITITSGGLYDFGDTLSGPTPSAPSTTNVYNMYGVNFQIADATPAGTPEPGSLALFAGVAVTGGLFARRRKRA